jgi:hypothetical protein
MAGPTLRRGQVLEEAKTSGQRHASNRMHHAAKYGTARALAAVRAGRGGGRSPTPASGPLSANCAVPERRPRPTHVGPETPGAGYEKAAPAHGAAWRRRVGRLSLTCERGTRHRYACAAPSASRPSPWAASTVEGLQDLLGRAQPTGTSMTAQRASASVLTVVHQKSCPFPDNSRPNLKGDTAADVGQRRVGASKRLPWRHFSVCRLGQMVRTVFFDREDYLIRGCPIETEERAATAQGSATARPFAAIETRPVHVDEPNGNDAGTWRGQSGWRAWCCWAAGQPGCAALADLSWSSSTGRKRWARTDCNGRT